MADSDTRQGGPSPTLTSSVKSGDRPCSFTQARRASVTRADFSARVSPGQSPQWVSDEPDSCRAQKMDSRVDAHPRVVAICGRSSVQPYASQAGLPCGVRVDVRTVAHI